ncbi:MAG: hypothetical protein ACRYGR_04725 [Janthinobacterium lividum]
MTTFIYLIGRPGVGKYTIATEIAKTGYQICDNQLINNPIFSLLGYDGFMHVPDYAWETIEKIRNSVFNFLIQERHNNYILTNVVYEGEESFYKRVEKVALARGSTFIPVKLVISQQEHQRRIQNLDRQLRFKSRDIKHTKSSQSLVGISHPYLLELDVSHLTPVQSAQKILSHISQIDLSMD